MSHTSSPESVNEKTLELAHKIPVYDENGRAIEFGSLFAGQKTIVVFIRAFICGFCQAYVEGLGKVPKSVLDSAGTRVVVIGCGEWSLIKGYRQSTGNYPYEIYTDPTRKLYSVLSLVSNFARAPANERKSYAPGMGAVITAFVKQAISLFGAIGKAGNRSQNGGDFIFGPGHSVTFSSKMKNVEDHVEVRDLMAAAGVQYEGEWAPIPCAWHEDNM